MESLLTMWENFIVRVKALGRNVEQEEYKFMEELKNRVHAIEVQIGMMKEAPAAEAKPDPAAEAKPDPAAEAKPDPASEAKPDPAAGGQVDPAPFADASAHAPGHS